MKRKAKHHGQITAKLLHHLGRQYGRLMSESKDDNRAFDIYAQICSGYFAAARVAEKHDKKATPQKGASDE